MNYGTKQRINGFLKAAGLTALFAIGMSEPDSKPPTEEADRKPPAQPGLYRGADCRI